MTTERPRAFDPRRARRWLMLLSIGLFALLALLVLILIQLYGYKAVRDGWDALSPAIVAIKWGGMLVLIWRWDSFIAWIAERQRMSDGYRDYLVGMHWRVGIALVILEVLFGQNLLAHLLN